MVKISFVFGFGLNVLSKDLKLPELKYPKALITNEIVKLNDKIP